MTESKTTPHWIERVWQPRWLGAVVAASVAALAGVLTAWAMPHGPATALQALLVLFTCLATGVLAGLAMRSRWSLLLAPLAYILAVELARRSAVGTDCGRHSAERDLWHPGAHPWTRLSRNRGAAADDLRRLGWRSTGAAVDRGRDAAGSSRAGSDLAGWLPLAAGAIALLASPS